MRIRLITLLLGAAFLLLSGFRPGTLPYNPGAVFSDATTSHLPAAQFLRASVLEHGTFPLWRETILAGEPFAANPLNKTAYPLQWLVLLLPPVLHLDALIVLHLLIAGVGMWKWARLLSVRDEAACLSGLAYALAPRVLGHTGAGHLDLLYALAWFPWLMWAVRGIANVGDGVGAGFKPASLVLSNPSPPDPLSHASGARGRTESSSRSEILRNTLYVALFAALMLLADVRLSLFAYALAGAYALYEALRLRRRRALLYFTPAALLVAVLTLSFTVPLLGWSPYLSRASMTPDDAGVFSLDAAQLAFGLVLPAGGNVETLSYVGLSVLALAVLGAVAARRWFWAGAALVAALYATGIYGFFWPLLVRLIPALLWFRVPSRAWLVFALIAPLLAGYGVDWLLGLTSRVRRRGVQLALVFAVAALACGAMFSLSAYNPYGSIQSGVILVGGGGIGVALFLALTGRLRGQWLAAALIGVTFVDLALAGGASLEWRGQDAWLPPDQVHLAERLVELKAGRVYSPTYSLQQQAAEEYHLRLFGGVDPFQVRGVVEAITQGGGIVPEPLMPLGYSVVQPPIFAPDMSRSNEHAVPDATILGQWGVTHVVSAYPIDAAALVQVDQVDGAYIYENMSAALVPVDGWPSGWPDLPDAVTVDGLNRATEQAALVSGVGFAVLLLVLGLLKVRH